MSTPRSTPDRSVKPRVLIVASGFPPAFRGGSIRTVDHLVRRLSRKYDFFVLTSNRDFGEPAPLDVATGTWLSTSDAKVRYERPWRRTPRAIARAARHTGANLVMTNSVFASGAISTLLAHRLGYVKSVVVVSPDGEFEDAGLAYHRGRKVVFLRLARAFGLFRNVWWRAASTSEYDSIRGRFPPSTRISLAANLAPTQRNLPAMLDNGPRSGPLRLVFLSTVTTRKSPSRAAQLVLCLDGVTLDVFGPEREPEEVAALTAIITQDATKRVRYAGTVNHADVHSTLGTYDGFIFPTGGESLGYVIGEALLAGCPVLTSDQTPWADLAESGAGWTLPVDNDDAWIEAIRTLRNMSPEAHAAMRRRSRDRGETWIADTNSEQRWIELIDEAIKNC